MKLLQALVEVLPMIMHLHDNGGGGGGGGVQATQGNFDIFKIL